MTELFRTVLNMSITGAYIAAAIIILRLFMKKLPKKYSYMLWAILGIRLLCPFSFSSTVSLFNVLIPEKPEISSGQMEYIPSDIEYSYEPKVTVSVPPVNETVNTYLPPAEPNNSANLMQIVMSISAIVWLVGMAAMVIYTVLSYISVRKRVKGAKEQNGIFICENIETPFVFGIIKPRIYLPENVSEEDMRYIIAHEQTHIRRGDHIVKLIAMAALCVHWFDPMVWISYRLMTKDMELSCDEKALGTFDEDVKKAYANALLNISMRQNKLTLGGVLSFGESDIKSRIKGVLGAKKPKVIVTIIAVIAVIIAAVCLLTNAVKKEKEFASISDGVYVTDKLLYTAPYKDSYWGDDNGLSYEIKGSSLVIINLRGGGEEARTFTLSEPMEIPFTEEEWSEAFDDFEKTGWQDGEKNLGDYDNKYCYSLQSDEDGGLEHYVFVMDDELWYVTYGWEIYRLKLSEDNFTEDIQEDIPEDVSDDDVTDEPAYSLPANEAPPLQTSDEYESENFGEFKKVSHKRQVMSPDEYGGYNIIADAELVDVQFIIPQNWSSDGYGLFTLGEEKVMEQNVVYPDSYGLMTEGFTVDMVSGREIKKLDEKYGGENDPYSYYVHTSMQSYDGVHDTHYFVVQQNGYYVTFCFRNSEDFSFSAAEEILKTVEVSPLHTVIDISSMQNCSVRMPIGAGSADTSNASGAADVSFALPSEWEQNNNVGYYYGKLIFRISDVYNAVKDKDYSALNSGDEVEVIDENYAVDSKTIGFDYMVHKKFYGAEMYEYAVTRGDISAIITFYVDESLNVKVRNAIIESIKIERSSIEAISEADLSNIDFSVAYNSSNTTATLSVMNNTDRDITVIDDGIFILEDGEYTAAKFMASGDEITDEMLIFSGEGIEYYRNMSLMAYPSFKPGKYRAAVKIWFSGAPEKQDILYAEFEIE